MAESTGRLDSWKQIANYLGRDVRTVIRWENERGLPIHRIPGKKGHGVFAQREEVDAWLHGRSEEALRPRIGVLPLANTIKVEQEYIADGISENVIRSLSKIPSLRVMAWSTVASFRGAAGDPVRVGRQLSLNAIATGRVAQRNGFWQVNVELVDPTDGAQLWGKEYTKPAMDIQTLPNQIARDIVSGMDVHFGKEEAARLTSKRTVNAQAYDLLLHGRYYFNQFTAETFAQALQCLERAVSIDPEYAEAYAELANCYVFLAVGYGDAPPRELLAKAATAARKAVALDETLSEAHCALGMASLNDGWDWRFVEKEFKLAIELNPSSALPHTGYATLLHALCRTDEGLQEGRWAMEVDPLAPIATGDYAFALAIAGRNAEALKLIEQALERFPSFSNMHYLLGVVHEQAGRYDEAIESIQKTLAAGVMHTIPFGVLGHIFAKMGNREKAFETLSRLDELAKVRPVAEFTKALIYAGLFDTKAALECLEKAYRDKSPWLYVVNWYPWLEPLRGEPGFIDLVRRVGLPPRT
jgi:serine/threonine-protein kinase